MKSDGEDPAVIPRLSPVHDTSEVSKALTVEVPLCLNGYESVQRGLSNNQVFLVKS